jgi:hypothetical protein
MIDLNGPGSYLTVGWLQLSWANAIVIGGMLLLFAAALLLPFPGHGRGLEDTAPEVTS